MISTDSEFVLEDIGLFRGDSGNRVGGALGCDRALVALDAQLLVDLEEEGAVAVIGAALDASGTSDAQIGIDDVLVVIIFDPFTNESGGGAEEVFGGGGESIGFGLEVTGAEVAVAAEWEDVEALDGGGVEDAVGGTSFAVDALVGVDLPDHLALGFACGGDRSEDTSESQQACAADGGVEQVPSGRIVIFGGHSCFSPSWLKEEGLGVWWRVPGSPEGGAV